MKYFLLRTFRVIRFEKHIALILFKVSTTWKLPDRIYTFCVCVCVCVCVRARARARVCVCVHASAHACHPRSVDFSGRKLSFIQIFESNVQNVHYSVNKSKSTFSFLIMVSVSLELSLHKLFLFYSSCLI